jgi:dihydroflavonol-4-reductase
LLRQHLGYYFMRVFITGGSGFIGSVVVRKLLAAGRNVRCIFRNVSPTTRIDGLKCECIRGDIRDAKALVQAMRGCDTAIHLASLSNWTDIHSSEMEDVVEAGTRNVITAARETDCSKLVYVSSSLAITGSSEPRAFDEAAEQPDWLGKLVYSRTKANAERLCRMAAKDGLPVTIVNPCEVYGPNDIALVTAANLVDFAKSSPVLVCDGGTSVVHVDDVADGIIAALDRGRSGERYILGGDNLTVRQIAELTLELLGLKRRIVSMPNWAVRSMAWAGKALRIPLPFNPEIIPYATRYWFMDNSKAKRELNVTFRNARQTLAPTLRWLQESGHIR